MRQPVGVARLDKGVLRRNHHLTANWFEESLGKKGESVYHLKDDLQQGWQSGESVPGEGGPS